MSGSHCQSLRSMPESIAGTKHATASRSNSETACAEVIQILSQCKLNAFVHCQVWQFNLFSADDYHDDFGPALGVRFGLDLVDVDLRIGDTMTRLRKLLLIAVPLLLKGFLSAQASVPRVSDTPIADDSPPIINADFHTIRKDIRSIQKQVIAANMKLTDTEAVKFWPVYDKYMSELDQIDDTKYALMKQDIDTHGAINDADAESVAEQWVEVDRSIAQLRLKYIPSFRKVLSPKKTALFCQLERHVQMTIDMRLASSLPVIEP